MTASDPPPEERADAPPPSERPGARDATVRRLGAGRIQRPFAWAWGVMTTAMVFLGHAMPPQEFRFEEPYKDYKWVVVEEVVKVGPWEALRGPLMWACALLFGTWLVSAWLNRGKERPAELALGDDAVEITYDRAWRRRERVPYGELAAAQAPGQEDLVLHTRVGGRYEITTENAPAVAAWLEERRGAAPALPAGLGWNALPGGALLRWGWAIGGWYMLMKNAGPAGTAVASGQWGMAALVLLLTLIWLVAGFTLSSRTDVLVGSDGVTIDHPWRRRFVPYHLIDGVDRWMGLLRLQRKDGESLVISTENVARLEADLEEALDRYHNPEARAVEHHHQALARGDRSDESWREDLAKLVDRHDYRGARLRVADLEGLVTDGHADPEQRVAAALALPKDDETRERIRIAAARCADVDTKAAIEAAAEGEVAAAELGRATERFRAAEV